MCVYVCVSVCKSVSVPVCLCVCLSVYVCLPVCMILIPILNQFFPSQLFPRCQLLRYFYDSTSILSLLYFPYLPFHLSHFLLPLPCSATEMGLCLVTQGDPAFVDWWVCCFLVCLDVVDISIRQSVCVSVCLCGCVLVCLSVHLCVGLCVYLFVCLCSCLCVSLYVCVSVCLSVCLSSVHMFLLV